MLTEYFPDNPASFGFWAPIYFEPIIGSGERITCGIAVEFCEETSLIQTINEERLKCMFGIDHDKVNRMIKLALVTMEYNLEANKTILTWKSEIEGFLLGELKKAKGRNLSDIKRQAIMQASFLLSRKEVDNIVDAEIEMKIKNERWLTKIRKYVSSVNPTFEKSFNQYIEFGNAKSKIRYGYLTGVIAANFSLIVPKKWTVSVEMSKAKIYDLELLSKTSYLTIPDKRELILGISKNPGEVLSKGTIGRMNDTLGFIKENAGKEGIDVFISNDEREAGEHILLYA